MNENPNPTPVMEVSVRMRKLNDFLRNQGRGGKIMLTAGISNLPEGQRNAKKTHKDFI